MTFEDDLLALERRVLIDSAGDFLTGVAELRRMLAADHPGVIDRLLALAIPSMEQAAKDGVRAAWLAGGAEAVSDAEIAQHVTDNAVGDARLRIDAGPPRHLTDPLDGLDALLADARTRSVALIRSGATPDVAAAPIFGAANTARLRVVTQLNAGSNAAAVEVGDAARSPMVWESERDACVYCLALAGEVIQTPGDPFPPADLYADPPPSQWTVSRPPLHGHCRCRIALLVSPDYADALKREAQRSVLRGHSLASESQAVRVRAASRLLERDPIAPKSVKDYARQAVKRGHFPKGREVPHGDPRLVITRGGPPASPKPPEPPSPPPLFDLSGFKRVKPETGLAAAKKTNPLQPTNRAYQINCSHVVNAVELRQRGLDVVATPRPSLQGRYTEETAADWIAPDGQPPQISPVRPYRKGGDLEELELATAHLPQGARGFVRVAWKAGGAHIFNWEKTGEGFSPGLKFHEGQVEKITSVQARAYFKRVKPGSVAWFRVDDAQPASAIAQSIEPSANQAAEAARFKAAAKAEAERKANEEAAWRAKVAEGRARAALMRTLEGMSRLEVMRRFGIDSPEFRAFTREEMRRANPI